MGVYASVDVLICPERQGVYIIDALWNLDLSNWPIKSLKSLYIPFHPHTSLFPPSTPAPALVTTILKVSGSESSFRTIQSSYQDNLGDEYHKTSIEIPVELVLEFATMNNDSVRAVSFLYSGVENLFPSGYPGRENKWA